MNYGWMLLALLAGLWTGLLIPLLTRAATQKREENTVKQSKRDQEQLLSEWLYGDEAKIGG